MPLEQHEVSVGVEPLVDGSLLLPGNMDRESTHRLVSRNDPESVNASLLGPVAPAIPGALVIAASLPPDEQCLRPAHSSNVGTMSFRSQSGPAGRKPGPARVSSGCIHLHRVASMEEGGSGQGLRLTYPGV